MPLTPGIRCTMFFSVDVYGISETHVWKQDASFQNCVPEFTKLIKARLQLSGFPLQFFGGRMSLLGAKNITQLVKKSDVAGSNPVLSNYANGAGVMVDNKSDQPKSCLTLLAQNSTGPKKQIYLAGIPDVLIGEASAGPKIVDNGWWQPFFDAYVAVLENGKWGWIARTQIGAAVTPYAITGIVKDNATNLIGLVTGALPGSFVQGAKVQVQGVARSNKAFAPLGGTYRINTVLTDSPRAGATTVLLYGTANLPFTSYEQGTGTVRFVDYSVFGYSDVEINKQTTRKRGNRFLAGPGRRKTLSYIQS